MPTPLKFFIFLIIVTLGITIPKIVTDNSGKKVSIYKWTSDHFNTWYAEVTSPQVLEPLPAPANNKRSSQSSTPVQTSSSADQSIDSKIDWSQYRVQGRKY